MFYFTVTVKCADCVDNRIADSVKRSQVVNPEMCDVSGCSLGKDHAKLRHNPTLTGYDYNTLIDANGGCIRNSWPEPTESGTHLFTESKKVGSTKRWDVSTSSCQKLREVVVSHRARCSLWIWTCLIHGRIIGYHVMKRGEGTRDALLSLYKFKRVCPKAIFVDFACHGEEAALNWLPEYFQHCQFFHDMFHSYGHVCSRRFSTADHNLKLCENTSLMEQLNAFLQVIRGLLMSGTTRVRTMY